MDWEYCHFPVFVKTYLQWPRLLPWPVSALSRDNRRREAFDPFADGGRSLRPADHGTEDDGDERALAVAQPAPRATIFEPVEAGKERLGVGVGQGHGLHLLAG